MQFSCCVFLSSLFIVCCKQELCVDEVSMLQAIRHEPGFGSALASSVQGLQQLSATIWNPSVKHNAPLLPGSNDNLLQARSTLPAPALNQGSFGSELAELELALAMERRQKQQVLAENTRLLAKDAALMQALTAATASGTSSMGSIHGNTSAPNGTAQQAAPTETFHGRSFLQAYWSNLEQIPFFSKLSFELKVAVAGMIAASVVALLLSALQRTLGSSLLRARNIVTKGAKGAARWSRDTKEYVLGVCLIYGVAIYFLWQTGCIQPILSSLLVYVVLASFVVTLLVVFLYRMWEKMMAPFKGITDFLKEFKKIERRMGLLSAEDAGNLFKGVAPEGRKGQSIAGSLEKGKKDGEGDPDSDDDDDEDDEEGEPAGGGSQAASPEERAKKERQAKRHAFVARLKKT
eukprot:TRINITY_DN14752_c0_g1_i1.p1 TRINITY_DN14752_c0_g1~~TRINITY_DN14752_c0_g1_i1.p1  ORF type:complete len:405 (+),score=77.57 TRINITY_DN14752_c0_g1_i1:221-1435(+)